MSREALDFKAGNPGAVQHGNFINYYKFHPPKERIELLPDFVFGKLTPVKNGHHFLDLGCNTGDLTEALYEYLTNSIRLEKCTILGVDIDPILVQRAQEKNTCENIDYKAFDITDSSSTNQEIERYFQRHEIQRFSLVFCFSITMWIHLNQGDEGLNRFLQKMTSLGEFLIIEPQPWKCYKSAVKRLKSTNFEFRYYKNLKIRQNVEDYIDQFLIRTCDAQKLYESPKTDSNWDRKIMVYRCSK